MCCPQPEPSVKTSKVGDIVRAIEDYYRPVTRDLEHQIWTLERDLRDAREKREQVERRLEDANRCIAYLRTGNVPR